MDSQIRWSRKKFKVTLFCYCCESRNPAISNSSGLQLEFIPTKIGAGATISQLFTLSSNKIIVKMPKGVVKQNK